MVFDFDIYEYLRRSLPAHKRQTNRLALFYWPIEQIKNIWDGFKSWRGDMLYESRITGQKMALVDLLNKRVTNSGNSISIVETTDNALPVDLLSEATNYANTSLLSEATNSEDVPLLGEGGGALSYDFIVLVPSAVNKDEVISIVDRYVIAGFYYNVQNS